MVGGGERAVGAADRAAGEPQAVEGLRARDLVDEVQVDVEQARRDLVGGPDLVEQRASGMVRPAPAQAGGDDGEQGRLLLAGVLEVVGQVGVEGHAVAGGELVALAVDVEHDARRASTSAVSRLPGSCIGGSPGPPVRAPGASTWRRELGALAGQRRR